MRVVKVPWKLDAKWLTRFNRRFNVDKGTYDGRFTSRLGRGYCTGNPWQKMEYTFTEQPAKRKGPNRKTMITQYVIEARTEEGTLKFDCPQPEEFFGQEAITGITTNQMAQAIYRAKPDAVLTGDTVAIWPRLINEHWTARPMTW
jgi:hypothetical protein